MADLEARMPASAEEDENDTYPPGAGGMVGDWTGRICVAKARWVKADWTGSVTDWLRIYYDAVTPPAYTTSADYLGDWGDEYEVVRVKDLYAHHGNYTVNRA